MGNERHYPTLSVEEAQERIDELLENGWRVEEIVSYRVFSSDNLVMGEGDDEDEAWDDALYTIKLDEYREAKRKLDKWNASVAGTAAQQRGEGE